MPLDWIAPLLTLTAMEIVLGIDNVIFIAIVVGRLPPDQQKSARQLGLLAALVTRIGLLFALAWILGLDYPLFHLSDLGIPTSWLPGDTPEIQQKVDEISWRDIMLLFGGLFLIGKSTWEIHDKLEGESEQTASQGVSRYVMVLVQIAILDLIFSLDSVITAVGMARRDQIWIMVTAMVIAVGVMLFFAGIIGRFVHRHPTVKILALAFLILIGVMLLAEGIEKHIERGYIYFAMAFSLGVELLNLRMRAKTKPVELHEPPAPPA